MQAVADPSKECGFYSKVTEFTCLVNLLNKNMQ